MLTKSQVNKVVKRIREAGYVEKSVVEYMDFEDLGQIAIMLLAELARTYVEQKRETMIVSMYVIKLADMANDSSGDRDDMLRVVVELNAEINATAASNEKFHEVVMRDLKKILREAKERVTKDHEKVGE